MSSSIAIIQKMADKKKAEAVESLEKEYIELSIQAMDKLTTKKNLKALTKKLICSLLFLRYSVFVKEDKYNKPDLIKMFQSKVTANATILGCSTAYILDEEEKKKAFQKSLKPIKLVTAMTPKSLTIPNYKIINSAKIMSLNTLQNCFFEIFISLILNQKIKYENLPV